MYLGTPASGQAGHGGGRAWAVQDHERRMSTAPAHIVASLSLMMLTAPIQRGLFHLQRKLNQGVQPIRST